MEEQTQTIVTKDDCVEENSKRSRGGARRLRRRKTREDRQLKIRLEATLYDKKFLASQALYRKNGLASPRCALCGKCKIVEDHTATHRHVTSLSRFREIFEVRSTLAFCVGCNSQVDWPEVTGHLEAHRMLPWYRPENVWEKLFSQGTWHPTKHFYCWACEALTANWWEAYEHCDLETHLRRVQGQTGWTMIGKVCKQWVVKGYSPDEDGKLKCRLCDVSFDIEDPVMHWKSSEHTMNAKRAARDVLRMGESGGLEQRCTETPSCEDSSQSCEDLTQSCEDLTPFCENVAPSCENATPSCENVAPSCENATPSCENVAPSSENAVPSFENATPSCENATRSCENAAPSCENETPSYENATPSCENAAPSCENATPSCENVAPSCKNATPSCGHSAPSCVSDKPPRISASLFKIATPSCKNATSSCGVSSPSCKNAAPSCKNAAPSCKNAAPSCKNATPSCENATPSCENAAPSCENAAPCCEKATPSCENAATSRQNATPSCENGAPSCENAAPSCARTNTKAKRRRRDKISLDSPKNLDASTFDAWTFLIGPDTLKLEKTLKEKFVPERCQAFAFYCVICADPIPDVKTAQNHVSGRLHEVSMKKYACKSIVSTPTGYHCKCCDRKMNLLSLVYRHVLENEHSMNHAFSKFVEMALEEADDAKAPLRKNSTPSCDRSETAKKIVSSSSRDDKRFVAGEYLSKKDGVETPSRDSSENSTPSCQRSTAVSKRPNEIAHDSISEDSKSLDESEARFLEDLTFLIGPQMPKLGKCFKEKLATASSLGCKLYCVACNAPISNFQNAREHVSGRKHASSMKKNRCEDISKIEDGYYCKCCDHKMKSLSVVYHHVFTPRHTCHLENWSANDEKVPVNAPIIAAECSTKKAGVETPPSREDSRDSPENSTPSCQRSTAVSKRPNEIAQDSISEDSKSLDEPEARFLEDLTFLIGPQMPKLGKCLKEKLATASSLGCKLYCVACNAPISNFQNAREHVSGRKHASSMKKNRCEDISKIEDGYYCKCCDHKMKSLSVVYHHVFTPRHTCHLENWSANDEKVPVNAPIIAAECSTKKAGVETPPSREDSRDSPENSTPSCQRSTAVSKRPNEIAQDSISEDSKSLDEPEARFLEDLTFLIGPQMPKLGKCLKEKLATASSLGCKLYCVACNAPISNFQNAREHVSGRKHASSMKKNRCEDISKIEDGYYCKCCDHKMKSLSVVYHHVFTPRHTCHLENWSANDEKVPVNAPIIAAECSTKKAGVETPPSREDSRDSSENSTPSCQRSTAVSKRPNEIAHDSISEDSKSLDESEARFLEDLTFLIGPQMPKLGKCLKEKLATASSLGCKLYCVACNAPISNFQNAREHVSGRKHASSMKKNRCEDISKIEDGYYCKCCDHKMKRLSVVYHHVFTPRHTCHLENWSANDEKVPVNAPIIAAECSTKKAGVETPPSREDSRDSSENSTPSCQRSTAVSKRPNEIAHDSISEDSKSLDESEARFLEDLTFLIGPQMPKLGKCLKEKLATASSLGCKLYCVACNAPISNFQNAREHVSGRKHASSMKKNRCEDISKIEDGYYCKCCDHKMKSLSVVYHHVFSPRHTCHLENWSANDEKVPVNAPIIAAECSTKKAGVETPPSREDSRDSSENSTPSCQRSNTSSNYPDEISSDSIREDTKKWTEIAQGLVDSDEGFLKGLTFLMGPHTPKPGPKWKKKLAIAHNCSCVFYCVICAESIRDVNDARGHVSGLSHADSMKQYGCESIAPNENGYYCNCCNRNMGRLSDAFGHVLKSKHKRHLVKNIVPNVAEVRKITEERFPTKSVSETPSCSAKSTQFCENTTPSCNPSSRTSSNSTPWCKLSVATPLEVSYDRINQVNTNERTCHICWSHPRGIGNVHEHVSGSRHQQSLKELRDAASQQNGAPKNDLTKSSTSNLDNGSLESLFNRKYDDASSFFKVKRDTGKPEIAVRAETTETPPRSSLYDYIALKMAVSTMETFTDEPYENDKTEKINTNDASKKKPRSFGTRPIRIKCSMCPKIVPNRESLHSHLASHFSDYFVSAVATKDSNVMETSILELDDCASDDERLSPLPEFIASDEAPKRKKRTKRNVNLRKALNLLDFNKDAIYEMTDKIAEYELCSKLCLILDTSTIYCLVCREPVANTFRSFHDHLSSLDHCSYLEIMENDAAHYARYVDQFSDLDLAHEYMEDWSDETVRCYACAQSVANETVALRAHIYEARHSEARKALRIGATRISELLVSRANCDWYGVRLYWCVVCGKSFGNEYSFVAHLESPRHLKIMKKRAAKGKTMLLDYCQSCALLWYGYRVTRFYHERTSAHVVLARDGYYATRSLSKFAMGLLTKPEVYADARIRRFEQLEIDEASKQRDLLEELEDIVRKKFPNAKAYTFGSRVAGLSSENSDIDVYLDCRNAYDGNEPESVTAYFIKKVYDCLCNYPNSWDVDELLSSCRAPIIRAHHRETDLKCDLSFQNGLAVENTKMIRAYCTVYPPCRKLIIILRQWLAYCNLADPNIVKNYCLSWIVIFYLQSISVLPSVATLVKMRNKSRKIAGWEVGVSHEFASYEAHLGADDSSPIVRLLKGFFSFYADFDFRREVVCPLLGYPILKRDFIVSKNLPDAMKPYKQHVAINRKTEIFRMDRPMCIQDPFRMNDNLATSVGKRHLNAFRVFCAESLNFISSL